MNPSEEQILLGKIQVLTQILNSSLQISIENDKFKTLVRDKITELINKL